MGRSPSFPSLVLMLAILCWYVNPNAVQGHSVCPGGLPYFCIRNSRGIGTGWREGIRFALVQARQNVLPNECKRLKGGSGRSDFPPSVRFVTSGMLRACFCGSSAATLMPSFGGKGIDLALPAGNLNWSRSLQVSQHSPRQVCAHTFLFDS